MRYASPEQFDTNLASQRAQDLLNTPTSTRAHKSLIGEVYRREMALPAILGQHWVNEFERRCISLGEPIFYHAVSGAPEKAKRELARTDLFIKLLVEQRNTSNPGDRAQAISLALSAEGEHRENLLQHKENMS